AKRHFHRLDDLRMDNATALFEETAVGHLLCQGMLERVLQVWEEPSLVEELGGLEIAEVSAKRVVRLFRDCLQKREWHVLADNGCGLQEGFVLGREPLDARRQHCLHRGRYSDVPNGPRQPIRPTIASEHVCLNQRPDAFLQKERVAAGASDERRLERRHGLLCSQQAIEEDLAIFG